MQDGSRGTCKGLYLCTDSFTEKDVKRIVIYIKDRYKISCSIHKFNGRYRINILAKSVHTVRDIINPYLHDSMLYKVENLAKKYIRRPLLVTIWRIISLFARKYLKIRLRYCKI